jgi:hypothetical protein
VLAGPDLFLVSKSYFFLADGAVLAGDRGHFEAMTFENAAQRVG